MPCKHFGGTDACKLYAGGQCIRKHSAYTKAYYAANKEKVAVRTAAYRRDNKEKIATSVADSYKSSCLGKGRGSDSGQAGELIVRTDLLLRGLEVTVPENRSCPDDVHFRSYEGWISVQVKVARVNKKTGFWRLRVAKGKTITSDIIAWVNLHDRTIRYKPNVKDVPAELLDSPESVGYPDRWVP